MATLRYGHILFFRQFFQGKNTRLGNINIDTSSLNNNVANNLVFVSNSTNIFENLALEDWLYKNFDFEKQSLLFMWSNTPWFVTILSFNKC